MTVDDPIKKELLKKPRLGGKTVEILTQWSWTSNKVKPQWTEVRRRVFIWWHGLKDGNEYEEDV